MSFRRVHLADSSLFIGSRGIKVTKRDKSQAVLNVVRSEGAFEA